MFCTNALCLFDSYNSWLAAEGKDVRKLTAPHSHEPISSCRLKNMLKVALSHWFRQCLCQSADFSLIPQLQPKMYVIVAMLSCLLPFLSRSEQYHGE